LNYVIELTSNGSFWLIFCPLLAKKITKRPAPSEKQAKRYTQKHLFAPCLEMEFDVLTKKLPGLAIERLFVANHCQISGTIMAQSTVTRWNSVCALNFNEDEY
ncbi:MAG: hypothetical protein II793_07125, partial [Bacteroidales bacterium]|nr:hypothetical protein [Bacteroidales bacterium]